MNELLRLSHIFTPDSMGYHLQDFNMTIFSGELAFLLGDYNSGKHLIPQLLTGNLSVLSGLVFVDGLPVSNYSEKAAAASGFFYVDGTSSLADSLSVYENIFLLRKKSFHNLFYNKKASICETANLLEKVGLSCKPQQKIYELSWFQRLLVCIAKALSYNTRLLILNLANQALSQDNFKHMAKLLNALRLQGMSCLIIDNHYNPLTSISDTAVIISQGNDIKTIRHQSITHDLINSYFVPVFSIAESDSDSFTYAPTDSVKKLILKSSSQVFAVWTPGKIIGIIDYSPDLTEDFYDYTARFCQKNSAVFTLDDSSRALSIHSPAFRWIPKNSNFYLLENLSIIDNLLLPRYPEISGPCGYMKETVKAYCENAFRSLIHLPELPPTVSGLSTLQKRILSIYRFATPSVKALFVECPFINLDFVGQTIMAHILKKLSNEGFAVFLISKDVDTVHHFCTDVIICNHYKWENTITHSRNPLDNLPV